MKKGASIRKSLFVFCLAPIIAVGGLLDVGGHQAIVHIDPDGLFRQAGALCHFSDLHGFFLLILDLYPDFTLCPRGIVNHFLKIPWGRRKKDRRYQIGDIRYVKIHNI